jgi:hypothetical protein
MSVSLLASESPSPPVPMKSCRSDKPMPSAPSMVPTDSLVLCSDGTKEDSRSLVSSNAGFSIGAGLTSKRSCDSAPLVRLESKSAGVAGADSIAGDSDEYEDEGGCGVGSSSNSCESVSKCVGGGVVSGRGVPLNGGVFRGVDGDASSLGPGPSTGDRDGLFDEGREGDEVGV